MNQIARCRAAAVRFVAPQVQEKLNLSPATFATQLPPDFRRQFGRYIITIEPIRYVQGIECGGHFIAERYYPGSNWPTNPIFADTLGEICAYIKFRSLYYRTIDARHRWLLDVYPA
jgi:hypothetical protein